MKLKTFKATCEYRNFKDPLVEKRGSSESGYCTTTSRGRTASTSDNAFLWMPSLSSSSSSSSSLWRGSSVREKESECELVLQKILMGEDKNLRKSLRAETQRELWYKYWDSKKKKRKLMTSLFALQKLQPMKTYQLWCYLMRGKCYRNIPGAKGCNGKSTTDLKTKILFAVVENISKVPCYYSMDDH